MKETTKEILRKFGWYEERDVNIDAIIKYYETGTDIVFEPVKKFLREFGFLEISLKKPFCWTDKYGHKNHAICYNNIDINPINPVFPTFFADEVEEMEEAANERMLEVGTTECGMYKLAVSESGKVYYDGGLLADNFDDAWDKIIESSY